MQRKTQYSSFCIAKEVRSKLGSRPAWKRSYRKITLTDLKDWLIKYTDIELIAISNTKKFYFKLTLLYTVASNKKH